MAERKSMMGSKRRLAQLLSQQRIDGIDREIGITHEINRQSAVKELFLHVFFMSKFNIINMPLVVQAAESQYIRAKGDHEAAHCVPGQLFSGSQKLQDLLGASPTLQITVDCLFGRTDSMHMKFNNADSRAEENGLCDALRDSCNYVSELAKYCRFNRAEDFFNYIRTAFDTYRAAGIAAFSTAVGRQRALMKPYDVADAVKRHETISILDVYSDCLASADSKHQTVQGLSAEDLWRDYRKIAV